MLTSIRLYLRDPRDKLALPRDSSRVPLVPVTFNLDPPMDKVHFAGLELDHPQSPALLSVRPRLHLAGEGDTLRVECDFNSNLSLTRQTVQRWLRHYQTLLQAIVADATQPVSTGWRCWTSLNSVRFCENGTSRPRSSRKVSAFTNSSSGRRSALLMQWAIVAGQERLTYRELNRRAESLASALRRAGVGPDVLAGVCTERLPRRWSWPSLAS